MDVLALLFERPALKTALARAGRLVKDGAPRWIRCYDNGDTDKATFDRYTVVFTGRYRHKTGRKTEPHRPGPFWHLGASTYPFHPQGLGTVGESDRQIDCPKYAHLGKRVAFDTLPDEVQKFVWNTYADLWDLPRSKHGGHVIVAPVSMKE